MAAPAPTSTIQLSPASKAFVDNRKNSLGSWVISGFADAILLGIVLCQVVTFFRTQHRRKMEGFRRHYRWLVVVVTVLSVLKVYLFSTAQAIAIVWVQNVLDFVDPDHARLLVAKAWYQVSAPTMTAVTALVVQAFFAARYFLLSRNVWLIVPIVASMLLGFAGVLLSLNSIIIGDAKAKVLWLLVHLICAFGTDFLITCGTCWALWRRNTGGLASSKSLINRLLRLVFESAVPPTVVAAIDLIMTQTLDAKHLLWHLLLNFALQKLYVISLMYTINAILEYRPTGVSGASVSVSSAGRTGARDMRVSGGKRTDVEIGLRNLTTTGNGLKDQVFVQTQVLTEVSPSQGTIEHLELERDDVKKSGWQPNWDQS
ncbi:hypothetical protein MKEN_01097800 [Mycena kentingensis (nom. inval.)]|nr:hypothetical protein MKEN_01097800 [Mycena kentingensis (nom. inval.)]